MKAFRFAPIALAVAACAAAVAACATSPQAPCDECAIIDESFAGAGADSAGGEGDFGTPLGETPDTLFATGLCVDEACSAIRPGISEFAPRWALWSDGATKRRWFAVPKGSRIRFSAEGNWEFPVGTAIVKHFELQVSAAESRRLAVPVVPYLPQTEWLCGGAALAMVLRYWGEVGVRADDFAASLSESGGGITTDTLRRLAEARGYRALALPP